MSRRGCTDCVGVDTSVDAWREEDARGTVPYSDELGQWGTLEDSIDRSTDAYIDSVLMEGMDRREPTGVRVGSSAL